MTRPEPVVFLLDVDNTLVDNDAVIADMREHLTKAFGAKRQSRYWSIFEELRSQLGYALRTRTSRIFCTFRTSC